MTRGFTVFALWIALLMVGYERFVDVGQLEAQEPAVQEETYSSSTEGGDGLPPPPPCPPTGC